MLRASKKLLRAGGRTAFLTISIAPGISKRRHRRAARVGPRAVASDRTPEELMIAAGFVDVHAVDVTDDFLRTAHAWQEQYLAHEDELRPVIREQFDEQCANRTDLIAGAEDGLLLRTLVYGRKRG